MWEMQIPASSDGAARETVIASGSTASNASTPRFVLPPGKELRGGEGGGRKGEGVGSFPHTTALRSYVILI